MSIFLGTFFFLLGLAVGSFSNVVVLRSQAVTPELDKRLRTLGGRSVCFHCKKILEWYELIPLLSFVIQRGRCRGCRAKISWQYPLIEAITAVSYLFVGLGIAKWYGYALDNDNDRDLTHMLLTITFAFVSITFLIIIITRFIKSSRIN